MANIFKKMRPLRGSTEQKLEQIRTEYNTLIDDLNRRFGSSGKEEKTDEEKKNAVRR